jgi:hypothetical protein
MSSIVKGTLAKANCFAFVPTISAQSTYIGRDETGSVYLPTQLEHTLQLTLLVRVNVMRGGGGRAHPTLTSQD